MSTELLINPGTLTEIAPGLLAEAVPIDPFAEEHPDDVDYHEATHGVAAWKNGTDIVLMTVEAGPGYDGLTKLSRFDAVAAVAPHSHGHKGTSWDRYIVQKMGHSIESTATRARTLLWGLDKKIHNLASMLHIKRTLSGGEAVSAITMDEKPEAQINLYGPEGQKRSFVSKIRKGFGFLIPPEIEDSKKQETDIKTEQKNQDKETINNESLNEITHPLTEKIKSPPIIDLDEVRSKRRLLQVA